MTYTEMVEFAKWMGPHLNSTAPKGLLYYYEYCCTMTNSRVEPTVLQLIRDAAEVDANGNPLPRKQYFQVEKLTSLGLLSKGGKPNLEKVMEVANSWNLAQIVKAGQEVTLNAYWAMHYYGKSSPASKLKLQDAYDVLESHQKVVNASIARGEGRFVDMSAVADGNTSDESDDDSQSSSGSTAMQPPKSKKSKSSKTLKPPSKPAKKTAPGLTTPPKGGDKNTGKMNLVLPTPSPIKSGPRPWDEASKSSYHSHCGVGGNLCGWGHCTQCISLPGAKKCSVNDRCGWYGTCMHCKYIWETKNQS